jgi:ppGpp synthetase/RelA/SpoT-type nucleotidyltranferase
MNNKPLSPELTPSEIDALAIYLKDPETIARLKDTQEAVVKALKRARKLKRHVSTIRERTEIKSIESVCEKINDHRRDDNAAYSIENCRDMIGAQIICPYPDDVRAVIDWLYDTKGGRDFFKIVSTKGEIRRKQRERESRTGYRAYHICLRLKSRFARDHGLPIGADKEHFELQVKTTLEAGWDFKTHDVSYKAIAADPELQEHMKYISDSLDSIDKQTRLLRDRLIEEQTMLQELRVVARRVLFYIILTDDEKKLLGIDTKNIEQWGQNDLGKLEKALEHELKSKGINRVYTVGLALLALALRSPSRYKQEMALSCASYLVDQSYEKDDEADYISSLRIRALLRWAFHKTRHAVDDMSDVLQRSKELGYMNDYLYFVSELREPTADDMRLAKLCLTALESSGELEHIDTRGAYYIRFGKNVDALHKGLELVRQAKESARGDKRQPVVDAFCSYHEYIYLKRLSKVRRIE